MIIVRFLRDLRVEHVNALSRLGVRRFKVDRCQFRDKFGVCVGNCSLGLKGVCKGFYIRSADKGLSEVSYALSPKQSEAVQEVSAFKGSRPEVTGDLTKGRGEQKTKVGKISLWIQTQNAGTSRPTFQGNIDVDGDKTFVVAWLHGWKLVKLEE